MAEHSGHRTARKGYCKTVWSEGGQDNEGNDTHETYTIPRDWIVRSERIVYWPKSNSNKMVKQCVARPRDKTVLKKRWDKFCLVSYGTTFQDIKQADATVTTDQEQISDHDSESEYMGTSDSDIDGAHDLISKNPKRNPKPHTQYNKDYTEGEDIDADTGDTEYYSGTSGGNKPVCAVNGKYGDMSSSKNKLPSKSMITKGALKCYESTSTSTKTHKRPSSTQIISPTQNNQQKTSTPAKPKKQKLDNVSSGRKPLVHEKKVSDTDDEQSSSEVSLEIIMNDSQRSAASSAGRMTAVSQEYTASADVKALLVNMHADIKVNSIYIEILHPPIYL